MAREVHNTGVQKFEYNCRSQAQALTIYPGINYVSDELFALYSAKINGNKNLFVQPAQEVAPAEPTEDEVPAEEPVITPDTVETPEAPVVTPEPPAESGAVVAPEAKADGAPDAPAATEEPTDKVGKNRKGK